MARRLVGEFRPPREVVSMGIARVAGPGAVDATETGLRVDGRVSVAPLVPRSALFAVAAVMLLIGALVPGADRVVLPVLLLGSGVGVFSAFRSEYGLRGVHEVRWADVEHVARLPADPDVVAIVLAGPLAGTGSPEQLYFAPSNGVEALAQAFRDHAPAVLSMDLESALRELDPPLEID